MTKRMSSPVGHVKSSHAICSECRTQYEGGECPTVCACGSSKFDFFMDVVMDPYRPSELGDPEHEELVNLRAEVERLRRENAMIRASAKEDFDAANNWRRYVAKVGHEKASLYLVPPKKEDGH